MKKKSADSIQRDRNDVDKAISFAEFCPPADAAATGNELR